jgi:predicted protein tyrosine phosphatase
MPWVMNMSREQAEDFEPPRGEQSRPTYCISITERPDQAAHLSRRFAAILRVSFADLDPERHKHPPDQFRYMNKKDAALIAGFIRLAKMAQANLVVHCEAGVSRSAAVAEAALDFLVPAKKHFDGGGRRYANQYVKRLVCEALSIPMEKSVYVREIEETGKPA